MERRAGRARLRKLSGPVASPVLSAATFPIGPTGTGIPRRRPAPQLGSAQRIATNDARIQNPFRMARYGPHTPFTPTPGPTRKRTVVAASTAGSVPVTGRIDDSSGTNPFLDRAQRPRCAVRLPCFSPARFASACYVFPPIGRPRHVQRRPRLATASPPLQDLLRHREPLGRLQPRRWTPSTTSTSDDPGSTPRRPRTAGASGGGVSCRRTSRSTRLAAEGNSGTTNARFTISLSSRARSSSRSTGVRRTALPRCRPDFQAATRTRQLPPGTTTVFGRPRGGRPSSRRTRRSRSICRTALRGDRRRPGHSRS
jgi:hypothetical protein